MFVNCAEDDGRTNLVRPSYYDLLLLKWKENQDVLKQQKKRIQVLIDENYRLMTMISMLKMELKDVRPEFEFLLKSVKMLISETKSLDNLLNDGKPRSDKNDLGF